MRRFRLRVQYALVGVLCANLGFLVWMHHDLKKASARTCILEVLPDDNIDDTDRLTLVFDHPIARDSELNTPLHENPFEFSPAVSGHWTWPTKDRLEYKLDTPLPPGKVLTLTPASFETQYGTKLVGDREFEFRTKALKLEEVDINFQGASEKEGELLLIFNQHVHPDDLNKHLKLYSGRRKLEYTIHTKEPAKEIRVHLTRNNGNTILVQFQKDLHGHNAEIPLGKDVKRRFQVMRPFVLDSAQAYPAAVSNRADVYLDFSRSLQSTQKQPRITIKPYIGKISTSFKWDDLVLHGAFECGRKYTITVQPGLLAENGSALSKSQTIVTSIPDRDPILKFKQSRGTLSPNGNLSLDMKAGNIKGMQVSASRIYPNNLVAHLHGATSDTTSRDVDYKTFPLTLKPNVPEEVTLDLGGWLDKPLGIYRIHAWDSGNSWEHDSAIVAITDLGLTTKRYRDGLWVWVTRLSTAEPVEGVTVQAWSYTNQSLATATTGVDGVARLLIPDHHPDGQAWVVTAELEDDLTWLMPEASRWVLDDVDQSGRSNPRNYDVMLYTERGAYRPGDSIQLTGIIRDENGAVPPAFPLSLSIYRPDGKRVNQQTIVSIDDDQGVFHASYDIPTEARLGRWGFSISLPGNNDSIGSTHAQVEKFLPVRMEILAESSQKTYGPEDQPVIHAEVDYLFGKPASEAGIKLDEWYSTMDYRSERYTDYTFARSGRNDSISPESKKSFLDEHGKAVLKANTELLNWSSGLWKAHWTVTATEPGGRSVSKNLSAEIDTQGHHLGMHLPSPTIETGKPFDIQWVQVTGDDEPAEPLFFTATLERVEQNWTIEDVYGRMVWKCKENRIPIQTLEVDPENSNGMLEFTCPIPGQHCITARYKDQVDGTTLPFHASQFGSDSMASSSLSETVELISLQKRVLPGSTARFVLSSPFTGTLAVALETDRVIYYEVSSMESLQKTLEIPIPYDIRGGAYLTAEVIRPIDSQAKQWKPHRAMGMMPVKVDHGAQSLAMTIDSSKNAQPGETVDVRVRIHSPVDPDCPPLIHVWGVDDGILLTTGHNTPAPQEHFLAMREAVIETADGFGKLLPDHLRPASMQRIGAGGDHEKEPAHRQNIESSCSKPAIIWNTFAPANSNGILDLKIDIPEMTGRLRLMAVAVQQDQYGSTESDITVTRPLMIEAGWPRFVSPGDGFSVPVKLINNTKHTLPMSLEVEADELLDLCISNGPEKLNVSPGETKTIWLKGSALQMGTSRIRIHARADLGGSAVVAREEKMIDVRSVSPPFTETRIVRVQPGTPLEVPPPTIFLAGSHHTTVHVSASPQLELFPACQSLIDYPYGCVEQTTSRIAGLLHGGKVLAREVPEDVRNERIDDMIEEGIARIWTMQCRSGGLGYWPDSSQPTLWGSAWAADMLVEARRQGYTNGYKEQVNDLLDYLEDSLNNKDLTPNMIALLCSVLASHERANQGWMAWLDDHIDDLDIAGRAQLYHAWHLSGQLERAKRVLPDDTLGIVVPSTTGGRITSRKRQDAALLSVLCRWDPEHPWIPILAERLWKARSDSCWDNTLENASALAALTAYQNLQPADPEFKGRITDGTGLDFDFNHQQEYDLTLDSFDEPLQIESSGCGTAYAVIKTRGTLKEEHIRDYDLNLRARRSWLDSHGKPLDLESLHVGDLVLVEVTLSAPGIPLHEEIENIAILDLLPAGLEVENPALDTSALVLDQWDDPLPDRVEFHDDRVVLFASTSSKERTFRYPLRVTTVGEFTLPPIHAECMYDEDGRASLHGGGTVEVLP